MPNTISLLAVVGRLQTPFNDRGETYVGSLTNPYFDLLAKAAAEFQGSVLSPSGEELPATFSSPSLAVRAAVEMQRRFAEAVANLSEEARPYVRIGLHESGSEMANRIAKQAGAGRILISKTIREAVLNDPVRCTWQGQLTGQSPEENRTEDLFEVVWSDPAASISGQRAASVTTRQTVPVLPRFDILGELGRGGMGVVYKGRDRETGESVALKVLRSDLAESPAVLERFRNEVRLARKITHKNVCRIHDFHRDGDLAYISMEFVEGDSLRALLDQRNQFTVGEGLAIALQICAGLREAHAQGVVHRDLKPQNIMLDPSGPNAPGKVTLMDFGIARSVESGHTLTVGVIGTPAYMAPEQAEGKPVDHRTDIYALGLVMYEIFTGSLAFSGETMVSVMMKQIMEAPRPPRELQPSLPPSLEAAIMGCLAKSPDQRFAKVADLEAVLGSIAASIGAPVGSPTVSVSMPTMPVWPQTVPTSPAVAVSLPAVAPPAAAPPPAPKKWWKTAIGVTAMGCGVPVFLCCATLVIIVIWGSRGKNKYVPASISTEEPATPAAGSSTAASAKPKAKKTKSGPEATEQATPAPPPATSSATPETPPTTPPAGKGRGSGTDFVIPSIVVPPMNMPIPGMGTIPGVGKGKGAVNVQELVRQAKEMQVTAWIARGDAFMQAKKYDSAIRTYEMAAAANPENQEIKDKLQKAKDAKVDAKDQ